MKARRLQRDVGVSFSNNYGAKYGAALGSGKHSTKWVPLVPVNMNKPFWLRFTEWWTC